MAKALVSKRKADIFSNGVGLIGLGILFFLKSWWPGILLVIWASLVMRQYLTGRRWDAIITTIILMGLFVVYFFNIDYAVLLPVLFCLGGIYIIFREYFYGDEDEGEDKADEIKEDIDNE